MSDQIIGFAGMTHLGINYLAAAAERGFKVVGFDQDPKIIDCLKEGNLPINEPHLPELINKNIEKISFTFQIQKLLVCDVVYISMDVPTNDAGQSNLSIVTKLINDVSRYLKTTSILVILCQVSPGFTRALKFPLDRLFYQVETLVFGTAVERALCPERFIVGCVNNDKKLPFNYLQFLEKFGAPILQMCYESAELAKIAINCCLVASINVANTLSEICEKIGADWSEIIPALKLDKRIGQFAYLSPGLGLSGGNLERDLNTVLELSNNYGTDTSVVSAWIKNSHYRKDWVLRMLHQELLNKHINPNIAILGLAYKENTHSTKNSPALALLSNLKYFNRVKIYDPVVLLGMFPQELEVYFVESLEDAIKDVDAVVIMTPWPQFKNLSFSILKQHMRGRLIIDPYKVIDNFEKNNKEFTYLTLGKDKIIC